MICIELKIKPISINAAFQGRRFKTALAKQYERHLDLLLPGKKEPGPFYSIHYIFALKNAARTDSQNLLKLLTDAMVRKGIIKDDRYIYREVVEKRKSERNSILIEIKSGKMMEGGHYIEWENYD